MKEESKQDIRKAATNIAAMCHQWGRVTKFLVVLTEALNV